MFLNVFSWMLSHVPGFMRPGVNWLVEGLRRITGTIAALWNVLGTSTGGLFGTVAGFREQLARFAHATVNGIWWIRNVWIPARIVAAQQAILAVVNATIAAVRAHILAVVAELSRWAQWALARANELINGLARWAGEQLGKITAIIAALIGGLRHVMNGPAYLAEWLVGEMWKALLRRAFHERDRIFNWILRGSISFTRFLADTVEDMIVRML